MVHVWTLGISILCSAVGYFPQWEIPRPPGLILILIPWHHNVKEKIIVFNDVHLKKVYLYPKIVTQDKDIGAYLDLLQLWSLHLSDFFKIQHAI